MFQVYNLVVLTAATFSNSKPANP